MAETMFTAHQYVKFTAEKLALQDNPQTFTALYAARALAWGTAGYGVMADNFDAFMAPYLAQAAAIVAPVLQQIDAKVDAQVDAAFEDIIGDLKADFDAALTNEDEGPNEDGLGELNGES